MPGGGPTAAPGAKGVYFGKDTVGTTRAALAALPAAMPHLSKGVRIKALAGNSGDVSVGDDTVTVDGGAAPGFLLDGGDELFVEIDDPTKVFIIGSAAGQVVHFFGV